MDQARAGLPAFQSAGPGESARRVATGLRGFESEENRGPEHRLIPKKTALHPFSGEKTEPPTVPRHPPCRIISTAPTHTFLRDRLLAPRSRKIAGCENWNVFKNCACPSL